MSHSLFLPYQSDPIFEVLSTSSDALGMESYLVGGFVRDILLGRSSKDIDIVCIGDGVALAKEVTGRLGKPSGFSIFKTYGTARIKYKEMELDFVSARKESYNHRSRNPFVEIGTFQEDMNRRDFTINALAVCINKSRFGELIDPFGGLEDLNRKIIRTPLSPNIPFSDDPLRMMRAIRFASQLGFSIEFNTLKAIRQNTSRIEIISKERIADELHKIVLSPRPSVGFELLEKTGLLSIIFPEIASLKGIKTQEGIKHKDVFFHTLKVLDNLSQTTHKLWLRWTALLHDIGKPLVKRFDNQSGWTFHGHEYKGMKMLKAIFIRMRFPTNDCLNYVEKLVSLHMRPIGLSEKEVTDSAIRRLLFEAGDDMEDLMLLVEADITTKNPEKAKQFIANFQQVRNKLKEVEDKDRIRNFQPPVDGSKIMKLFSLSAGKLIGELKSAIKEAILNGEIPNEYEAAQAYLFRLAKQKGILKTEGNKNGSLSTTKNIQYIGTIASAEKIGNKKWCHQESN